MKKITIYAIHSNKLNYKEEFYRPLLLSEECNKHNLILPLTEKYQNMYAKDLVEKCDIAIINLTDSSFSVFIETNWAIKMNKKILFLIRGNGKCFSFLKKYQKQSQVYNNYEEEIVLINNFIKENIDDIASLNDDGVINLGSLKQNLK